ncbi:MAG: hypothetical protein PHX87_04670 [Candidatus Peribacteraceae bacterium]|nr:hypothetical protein [Candidatus Peribacteraceae bacterium]MDD5742691.1 hypothetical protein [Candidatus Peribacteraceae bacterium]
MLHTHTSHSLAASLRHFAHEHDELPAFHAGYLVLTVIAAAILNLGAFALLIAAHISLDLVKYREVHHLSWERTLEGTVRENLIDIFLLLIALTFSVYLHHTIGIVAMSGIVRSDLSFARLAGVFLPKFEILHRFLEMLLHVGNHMRTLHERLGKALISGERLMLFLLTATVILLLAAPVILGIPTSAFFSTVAHEMIPWRI